MLRRLVLNVAQLAVVALFSPLLPGVLARLEERVQGRRGPSIFQTYRDIWKLFHKDEAVPEDSTWIFRAAPYVACAAPLFVTLLIPVLTSFPLFWAFMDDMVGAGFILALGGFFVVLAAVDSTSPYGVIGASRTRMVGFLAEPVFMTVFFTVSFVAGSTIPFVVQAHWVSDAAAFLAPSHLLLLAAFLMLILAEKGRLPVDNPHGHFELAMIEESKALEYSGRGAALMKWAGAMKFFVLACVFVNVLVTPWGLASTTSAGGVVLAVPLVLLKILAFVLVLVAIESSLAKLRLFRITEFLGAAFVVCVIAMIARVFTA